MPFELHLRFSLLHYYTSRQMQREEGLACILLQICSRLSGLLFDTWKYCISIYNKIYYVCNNNHCLNILWLNQSFHQLQQLFESSIIIFQKQNKTIKHLRQNPCLYCTTLYCILQNTVCQGSHAACLHRSRAEGSTVCDNSNAEGSVQ